VSHRNHYGSDYHPDLTYDLMADDVVRFMDKKGLKKVTLGGLCFGGRVAMRLASKYPERIEGLVIVEATVGDYIATDGMSAASWKGFDYAAHHMTLRQYRAWVEYVAPAIKYDGWRAWHLVLARKDLPLDDPVQFKVDMRVIGPRFFSDMLFLPADWTYTGPVVVIVAAESQLTFHWDLFAQVFPGFSEANVVMVQGEDHRLMYKRPALVAKCWEQFFSMLDMESA
jgi:pimeloyl-ACP methyl ester carboxylesterase